MSAHLKVGQRCVVVKGEAANVGAQVTLLAYSVEAQGWLFDAAWPPLLIDGEDWRHSLEAPDGVLLAVSEDELMPMTEFRRQPAPEVRLL